MVYLVGKITKIMDNINFCTKCKGPAEVTSTIRNHNADNQDIYIITCKNPLCKFWKMSFNNSELYDWEDYDNSSSNS